MGVLVLSMSLWTKWNFVFMQQSTFRTLSFLPDLLIVNNRAVVSRLGSSVIPEQSRREV